MTVVKVPRVADSGWMDRAACKDADPEWFHPLQGGRDAYTPGKAVCAACPVSLRCLGYILAVETDGLEAGLWGGMTPTERHAYRRQLSERAW